MYQLWFTEASIIIMDIIYIWKIGSSGIWKSGVDVIQYYTMERFCRTVNLYSVKCVSRKVSEWEVTALVWLRI